MINKFSRILMLFVSLVLVSPLSNSQTEIVARIIVTMGKVEVVRANGIRETVQRRDIISAGDTVETPANGLVQLRFVDNSLVALGCASKLRVSSYSYRQVDADQAELILLAGSLRTVFGQIATDKYRLRIADTVVQGSDADFEVAIAPDGTQYFAVYVGAMTITNSQNQMKLGVGADADFGKLEPGFQFEELILSPPILGSFNLNAANCTSQII
ncbi:MAG: FecR domain-containing protein [Gammaproteobacteria bacterium]|nr:FecR domain-containing protein [Gammaproteobacteria bacterium]MBL4727780.1 FecR domain-containing protein [Gammaproteobacteria bacterium]